MTINRYELVTRHNPMLTYMNAKSPLTVGNGEFAYTVDITGMQSLYEYYRERLNPLCTMSQWGWHTTPVSKDNFRYTLNDVQMTEYNYAGRPVSYAVERKEGNEEVYYWLRQNPHRLNLARIGLQYQDEEIRPEDITEIHQTLNLYEGIIESRFKLQGIECRVVTCCHPKKDALAFHIESELLQDQSLTVRMIFPYGSPDITASDWTSEECHSTKLSRLTEKQLLIKRSLDQDCYSVGIQLENKADADLIKEHTLRIFSDNHKLSFSASFTKVEEADILHPSEIFEESRSGWKNFWNTSGVVDLHQSKDVRALELERRILLSQYQMAVNCSGSMPPQETGLICNSWHGKFHLEMYPWHEAYLPLWNQTELLEKSLRWYKDHLKEAKENAARNGFPGAKWPKQVAYDAIDSPSPIATLLIWQQPHIIMMLELAYQSKLTGEFLEEYYEVVKETADYMSAYAVFNPNTGKYDLVSPIIPAQEEHNPTDTINPTFEVEYWSFALHLAASWAERLNKPECEEWLKVAENMEASTVKDGCYLAHQNCPDTFTKYHKDHPSMLMAYGLIDSGRMKPSLILNTLDRTLEVWNFATTWGWDFAMMAMTATRLGLPELAIDILMMNTENNNYVVSGNNSQKMREDLPVYLPGNGSLLLAVAMMTAGYPDCNKKCPGFPENGDWIVEYENISPFPF